MQCPNFAHPTILAYLHTMKELSPEYLKSALQKATTARRTLTIDGYHRAGVLVPVVSADTGPELLFTRRTELVETHKGQISFPGGMADEEDADIVATALREFEEELGVRRHVVEVLGLLDDLPTPTGFVITPVVGILSKVPELSPNDDEVAEVFRVPLSFFAVRDNGRMEIREFRGTSHEVWFYEYSGRTIWGVTAAIIRLFLKRVNSLE